MCKGSFGGYQGQPSARPWHLLIAPLGLQPFPPHRFVSLFPTRLLPTLITISSSSIDSPVTHARLACSLPYTWAILPHIKRLREYKLYINLKKCLFYITSINFLGFIISVNRVLIEKIWVDTIRE